MNEKTPLVWISAGIRNSKLFEKLCQRWELNQQKLIENLYDISHAIGKDYVHVILEETSENGKTAFRKTGEKVLKEVIFVRSKSSGSLHRIIKSDRNGIWHCGCPSWIFKGGRTKLKPCKHLIYCIVNGLGRPEDWLQYIA